MKAIATAPQGNCPLTFDGSVVWPGVISGANLEGDFSRPVSSLVCDWAIRTPHAEALVSSEDTFTYSRLATWAQAIARDVADLRVNSGSHVAILMEAGADMITAALGVMISGCAYLPLDPALADDRIEAVLKDALVDLVLTDRKCAARLRQVGARTHIVRGAPADDPTLHAAWNTREPDPESTAYLIYTSGSSGVPKGVVVRHRNLAAMTAARRMVYPGKPRFVMVSPLACDSSIAGIWGTLTSGGTLIVPSAQEVHDPARLAAIIGNTSATHLLCVPPLYAAILTEAEWSQRHPLATMGCVIVAGEALDGALVDRHFRISRGAVALVNEYGPTEATVWASYHVLWKPGPAIIGGPVPGAHFMVLDPGGDPVAAGETGELCIGGAGVTAGYFNNEAATSAAFFDYRLAGGHVVPFYRTGDRVRLLATGALEFLGRADQQVKIRGHRVDLLAVEDALRDVEKVTDACVVYEATAGILTAFVECGGQIEKECLRAWVRDRLGEVFVPTRICVMNRFPKTVAGKIDRVSLREAALAAPRTEAKSAGINGSAAEAGQSTRDLVSRAWAEVLGISKIPEYTNFFELGGHSLMVFELQDALERLTGRRPSAVELFRRTTVSEQAALFDRDSAEAPKPAIPLGPRTVSASQSARARRLAMAQRRQSITQIEDRKDA